jgi:hypothetical protein
MCLALFEPKAKVAPHVAKDYSFARPVGLHNAVAVSVGFVAPGWQRCRTLRVATLDHPVVTLDFGVEGAVRLESLAQYTRSSRFDLLWITERADGV